MKKDKDKKKQEKTKELKITPKSRNRQYLFLRKNK